LPADLRTRSLSPTSVDLELSRLRKELQGTAREWAPEEKKTDESTRRSRGCRNIDDTEEIKGKKIGRRPEEDQEGRRSAQGRARGASGVCKGYRIFK